MVGIAGFWHGFLVVQGDLRKSVCRKMLKMLLAGLPGRAEARTLRRPGRRKKLLSPANYLHGAGSREKRPV